MAITVPKVGDVVDATTFGIPVANQLNASAVTAWTTLTLSNGWASLGSGYQTARYRKVGDVVELEGAIAGTTSSNTAIATLPSGFRPALNQIFNCIGAGGGSGALGGKRVDIVVAGTISLVLAATPDYLSLSGVRFSTV